MQVSKQSSLRTISRAALLAGLAFLALLPATAEEVQLPHLQIENRTSDAIDNIRLTSGERFLTENWKDEIPNLKPGLHTYPQKISAVSIGSNVHARLRGKEVIFRCDTAIEQRPKIGGVTCVLTEESGIFKAEYISTPFTDYFESPRGEGIQNSP